MITPVNYPLAAVNFFVGVNGLVQLGRIAQYVWVSNAATVSRTPRHRLSTHRRTRKRTRTVRNSAGRGASFMCTEGERRREGRAHRRISRNLYTHSITTYPLRQAPGPRHLTQAPQRTIPWGLPATSRGGRGVALGAPCFFHTMLSSFRTTGRKIVA